MILALSCHGLFSELLLIVQLLSFIVESGGRQPPIDDEDLEDDMDDFEEVDHPALDTIPTTLFQAAPPLHQ